MKKRWQNQHGFTLVELLVVMSILGMLAAIGVPKYLDSTASARTAKVQADLAALDGAIQLYMASNDGSLPTAAGILPFLSSGALPVAPSGTYMIDGERTSVTSGVYSVADGVASVALQDKSYTAATLKSGKK